MTDGNAEFQDFSPGYYMTWGCSTLSRPQTTGSWPTSPSSGTQPRLHKHYMVPLRPRVPLQRRRGRNHRPRLQPLHDPSDYHLPVRIGTDAALGLGMCRVIVEEGSCNKRFIQEQTDLPLLVRKDNDRFLRGNESTRGPRGPVLLVGHQVQACGPGAARHLDSGDLEPALEGTGRCACWTAPRSRSNPVFERLKRRLKDYDAGHRQQDLRGAPGPDPHSPARSRVKKTKIFSGWNSGKYYHGDLMERSMALLLALTGNWGRQGTGTRSWAISGLTAELPPQAKGRPGQDAARLYSSNCWPCAAAFR